MLTYDPGGRDHALTLLRGDAGGEIVIHGRRFQIMWGEVARRRV